MADQTFTYRVPQELEGNIAVGKRVHIPFGRGNRPMVGYCLGIHNNRPDFQVKDIIAVLDHTPVVSQEMIDLAYYMHEHYHSNLYRAFRAVSPPGDGRSIDVLYHFSETPEKLLTWDELVSTFGKNGEILAKRRIDEGLVQIKYSVSKETKPKLQKWVARTKKDATLSNRAVKQQAVLDYLKMHGASLQADVLRETGADSTCVQALLKKELVTVSEVEVKRVVLPEEGPVQTQKMKLYPQQKAAYESMQEPGAYLLHGITGSGKTEIYLQMVDDVLQKGQSAIVLVPEISLTPQTIERFTGRFGKNVALLHSKLSQAERFEQWKQIKNNEVQIAIGARSAVFAPFDNLGLIIIDEEQEDSYRSETHPRYKTVEIAQRRIEYHHGRLVLGTATPTIATYHASEEGTFKRLSLTHRANHKPLPIAEIVDMKEELHRGNTSMLCVDLRKALEETLAKGEQSILFLNKRGHSSFVFCRNCGFVKRCDDCDVSMTYHRSIDTLLCHYCGKTSHIPRTCPECGSNKIGHFGVGTEQLEEYISSVFPKARVARMDADTTTKKDAYEKFYEKMKAKEIDILIGTQMIAKGLDFENISLVGVIMADISLNMPHFEANEKTYQLISQVAGRAGRGKTEGRVILQTYHPSHFAIQTAAHHSYESFYEKEIRIRESFSYPPFVHMVTVISSSPDQRASLDVLQQMRQALFVFKTKRNVDFMELIGPSMCTIPRIRNQYRHQLILKFHGHEERMHQVIAWLEHLFYPISKEKQTNIQFFIE